MQYDFDVYHSLEKPLVLVTDARTKAAGDFLQYRDQILFSVCMTLPQIVFQTSSTARERLGLVAVLTHLVIGTVIILNFLILNVFAS